MKRLIFIFLIFVSRETFSQSAKDTLVAHANDSDGSIASYVWGLKSGPTRVTIKILNNHPDSVTITFTKAGTYVFTCNVYDNQGAKDTSNATQTTIILPAYNSPPRVGITPLTITIPMK